MKFHVVEKNGKLAVGSTRSKHEKADSGATRRVRSSDGSRYYRVARDESFCTCPSFWFRKACGHLARSAA